MNDVINENISVVGLRRNGNATSDPNERMQKTNDTASNAGKKSNLLKQCRKRKTDTLTIKSLEQHVGKPMGQAANNLAGKSSYLFMVVLKSLILENIKSFYKYAYEIL